MNKTIEINGIWYALNFLEKDTDAEFVKWHTFTMDNMLNANEFYIVQIIQENMYKNMMMKLATIAQNSMLSTLKKILMDAI